MIEEQATVVEVRPGRARVQTLRSGSCESCKARGGCSGLGGGREAQVWVSDPLGVAAGERVVIAVPGGTVVRASLFLYLLPVLALLAGAVLGNRLAPGLGFHPDLGAAGFGGLAMALAFGIARLAGRRAVDGPRIVGRV
ncbi:MAG TPA: SoxR reducing system RseC family protein [Deferrisomatales bacterium]|nr:SoxR reducing system RseC family protein [Deferrisomatales bacterium]